MASRSLHRTEGTTNPLPISLSPSSPVTVLDGSKRSNRRIFVVEDNAFVREALVNLIAGETDFVCCGQADSLESTLSGVQQAKPDLILIELRLRDGEAFELIKALKLSFPAMAILVISQCDEMLYAERALKAGASGYLMKVEAVEELLIAARTVLNGKVYLSHAMSVRLVQRVLKPGSSSASVPPRKAFAPSDPSPARLSNSSAQQRKRHRKIS